jgi:hypothetical protein
MAKTPEAPAQDNAKPTLDDLRAAHVLRAAIAAKFPLDQAALDEQDMQIKKLVLAIDFPKPTEEEWAKQPVMAQIRGFAHRRDVVAAYLLTLPTEKVSLYQRPAGEPQDPNQDVIYQGLRFYFPRDNKRHECPAVIAKIFDECSIR